MAPRWIGGAKIPSHPIETLSEAQWARPSEREPDPGAWYRNRRDEVGKTCPAALAVWTLMDIGLLRELYPLEMHSMLRSDEPFYDPNHAVEHFARYPEHGAGLVTGPQKDRKSTRLNSSHGKISYDGCCLKRTTIGEWPYARGITYNQHIRVGLVPRLN